ALGDLAGGAIDQQGLGADDLAEAERVGRFEVVVFQRMLGGAEPRDGEGRQDAQLRDGHAGLRSSTGARTALSAPSTRSIAAMVSWSMPRSVARYSLPLSSANGSMSRNSVAAPCNRSRCSRQQSRSATGRCTV